MAGQIMRPFTMLASWLGGWVRLLLLVLVGVSVGLGLWWESQRHPQVPPGAIQVTSAIVGNVRQTSFRHADSIDKIRAFYRGELPLRGWNYCGTQATPRCSNLPDLGSDANKATDVYRRVDDQNYRGATIEVQAIITETGPTYVTLFETRAR